MAIKSITIENFKGIGDAVTIPIRPITLLFGKNSSGKSTVLQALSYMLHVIKGGNPNPHHLMGMDTDFMNVGSFSSFVHLNELERKITIRIEFEVNNEAQLGWAEIKTGWSIERGDAHILSKKIGIGDAEWEYDDIPEGDETGVTDAVAVELKRREYLKTSFTEELESMSLLEPIRKVPSRDWREINYTLKIFDDAEFKARIGQCWDGSQLWAILLRDCIGLGSRQLIDKTNAQMRYLELGYEIAFSDSYVTSIRTDALEENLRELYTHVSNNGDSQDLVSKVLEKLPRRRTFHLMLKKGQIYLDVLDVGSGIAQIIPVLVGVLEDSYRTFAVAQPELHVHPAVQVGLGDLFIDGIKNGNRTILIETHSEHLLLRLLRRVRETTEGEQTDHTLTPDDLSIVYVVQTSEGVEFIPLDVMGDGAFDGPWPEGFFDERLQELL